MKVPAGADKRVCRGRQKGLEPSAVVRFIAGFVDGCLISVGRTVCARVWSSHRWLVDLSTIIAVSVVPTRKSLHWRRGYGSSVTSTGGLGRVTISRSSQEREKRNTRLRGFNHRPIADQALITDLRSERTAVRAKIQPPYPKRSSPRRLLPPRSVAAAVLGGRFRSRLRETPGKHPHRGAKAALFFRQIPTELMIRPVTGAATVVKRERQLRIDPRETSWMARKTLYFPFLIFPSDALVKLLLPPRRIPFYPPRLAYLRHHRGSSLALIHNRSAAAAGAAGVAPPVIHGAPPRTTAAAAADPKSARHRPESCAVRSRGGEARERQHMVKARGVGRILVASKLTWDGGVPKVYLVRASIIGNAVNTHVGTLGGQDRFALPVRVTPNSRSSRTYCSTVGDSCCW